MGEAIPAIVLLIAGRQGAPDYSAAFESEGLWVSSVTDPAEAVAAIRELRPDVVVADMANDPDGRADIVRVIKHTPQGAQTPIVVLCDDRCAASSGEADLRLTSDVPPHQLVGRVVDLLEHYRGENAVSSDARASDTAESRTCPRCAQPLSWIERGRLGGVDYDYYRWCLSGCGLYCFEITADKWVKLT